MAKTKKHKTNNLVVVSDLHCGCRVGLCPPEPIELDDGGEYHASKFQQKVWAWWTEFWEEWVPHITQGEPYDVVINGDTLEGEHHGSHTYISANEEDQKKIARKIVQPIRDKAERLYMIRGTEAHDGKSGANAETLAREMGTVRDPESGQFARWELCKRVGGAIAHLTHHISVSSSPYTKTTALVREWVTITERRATRGVPIFDFIVRAHRHRYDAVPMRTPHAYGGAIGLPGWQGKTPFAFRTVMGRCEPPQFGGIVIRQGDEDCYHREFQRKLDDPAIE